MSAIESFDLFWFCLGVAAGGAAYCLGLSLFLYAAHRAPREDEYFTRRVRGEG